MGFNEIVFMELRLMRMLCNRLQINTNKANEIFKSYGIFDYIESCYDVLHTEGDQNAFDDIVDILSRNGALS